MIRGRGGDLRSILLLLALAAASASAAAPAETGALAHEERAAMADDPQLALRDAVDAALQRAPGAATLEALAASTDAYRRRSESWIAGAPAVQLRYLSDRLQTRDGVSEAEAGVELPLWRWGQRDAVAGQARSGETGTAEAQRLHRWRVAGLVRERYWDVREAQRRLELAQADRRAFAQLEQDVLRRIAAGDAAPGERLTAEGQRREREAVVHEAEVQLADRSYAWRVLTGLDALPAPAEESVAAESPDYLPLHAAEAAAARAEAALAAGRAEGAGTPKLLLGTRRDTQNGTPNIDSLTAQLIVPFGGGSHRAAALSPLQIEAAQARDEVRRQQQESQLAHHEAEHELHAREVARAEAGARNALAQQEVALARRAYALGESALAERLQTEIRAAEAGRSEALAVIAHGRAIARYNQINGAMP